MANERLIFLACNIYSILAEYNHHSCTFRWALWPMGLWLCNPRIRCGIYEHPRYLLMFLCNPRIRCWVCEHPRYLLMFFCNPRIHFSEPPEDAQDADCEDAGLAFVSIRDILFLCNPRIRFTLVSEPPEDDQDVECEDVGLAFVSIRDILSCFCVILRSVSHWSVSPLRMIRMQTVMLVWHLWASEISYQVSV